MLKSSRAPPRALCTLDEDEKLVEESANHGAVQPILDTYEYDPKSCEITTDRLARARSFTSKSCTLNAEELAALREEQDHLAREDDQFAPAELEKRAKEEEAGREQIQSLRRQMLRTMREDQDHLAHDEDDQFAEAGLEKRARQEEAGREQIQSLRRQMLQTMVRARSDQYDDGVLGVQPMGLVANSLLAAPLSAEVLSSLGEEEGKTEEHDALYERRRNRIHILVKNNYVDAENLAHVRKPDLAKIVSELDRESKRPKYTLKQVLISRRFHLYKHRFANTQFRRALFYPTLPQPREPMICGECADTSPSEKDQSRPDGFRFILAADTQFGILMDGYAMENPNWSNEIEISRQAVTKINAMTGKDRPLFVCVCGDLVDTESSFSRALASWKKVMSGWQRNLVFEQQVKDFKRVWSRLDPDIALVCLCGNHDVGNRPTLESIEHWTSSFGDDFFAFWVNGSFHIALNNCLFSDPTGAPDLFKEQLLWLEEKLSYARSNNATHIFVYGHYPWFLKHEEETDDEITTISAVPEGWGPPGTKFPDGYFTIPYEERQLAMILFRKYGVTACFSGHFHQNVIAATSWGMPMIVTGPLSMTLKSEMSNELSQGEPNGIGIRLVDVGSAKDAFTHKFILLDDKEEN